MRTGSRLRRRCEHREPNTFVFLGVAFDAALYTPVSSDQHYSEMDELADRLARVEARLAGMDSGNASGLAPAQGSETDLARRRNRLGAATQPDLVGEPPRSGGAKAQAESETLATPAWRVERAVKLGGES